VNTDPWIARLRPVFLKGRRHTQKKIITHATLLVIIGHIQLKYITQRKIKI